jgi:4-oxalocrotonate tautomerase
VEVSGTMPIVRIEFWEGRSLEQKRALASQLTRVVSRIADCDPSVVQVLFQEYPLDSWSIAGTLESDRKTAQVVEPRQR